MIRRLSILAAAAALAASAVPAVAAISNTDTGQPSVNAPSGPSLQMEAPHDPDTPAGKVALDMIVFFKPAPSDHTAGTVSIWNNGDGDDTFSIDIGTSDNAKQAGRLEWPVLDYVRTPVR
jgi:hypothetical protein